MDINGNYTLETKEKFLESQLFKKEWHITGDFTPPGPGGEGKLKGVFKTEK
jgi:hypothetical protein